MRSGPYARSKAMLGWMRVPDAMEPVVGWRCWRVRDSPEGFALTSACRPVRWEPGRPLEASCEACHGAARARVHLRHLRRRGASASACLPPAAREGGGPDPHPAILGYDIVMAVGLAALWGAVIECEWGWRGAVRLPDEPLRPVAGIRHFRRSPAGVEIFDSARVAVGARRSLRDPRRGHSEPEARSAHPGGSRRVAA